MALYNIVELDARDRCWAIRLMRRVGVFLEEEVDFFGRMFDQCRLGCGPCELRCAGAKKPDGMLAGLVCYGVAPLTEGTFDIYWFAVDPEEQRKGVGAALMRYVCEEARGAGARQLLVETSSLPKYRNTRAAYRRMGFVQVARIPDYYRPKDDRLIFVRKL